MKPKKFQGCSKSGASYLFMWKQQQVCRVQQHYLIEKILSYKSLLFNIVTIIVSALLRVQRQDEQEPVCSACKNLNQSLWTTVTVVTEKHHPSPPLQALMKVSGVQLYSAWRNSIPHLCFIFTSMSDPILSDCPSAAICHMAKNGMEYWQEGSTAMLYCQHLALTFWASIIKPEALLLEALGNLHGAPLSDGFHVCVTVM